MRTVNKIIGTKKNKSGKSAAGFTLIELLVVVAIIGLLSSVVLVSMNAARKRARDAKRKADVAQIRKALEIYALDNGDAYPNSGLCTGISGCYITNIGSGYLSPAYILTMPTDPLSNLTTYPNNYFYAVNASATGYKLFIPFGLDGSIVNCVYTQGATVSAFTGIPLCPN